MTAGTAAPIALAALLALVTGCQRGDERIFFNAFAMTGDVAPIFENDDASLVAFEQRIELPIRPPSERALAEREIPADQDPPLPFPRLPWVERGDFEIEIDVVLTNVTAEGNVDCPAETVQVALTLNGINEFFEYDPGFVLDDDEVIPNFAQWERLFVLGPGEAVRRTLREGELEEVAVDLAILVNGAPNPNEVVFRANQYRLDPDVQPFIPAVVPGLVGVKLGVRTTAATCLVVESSLRVRDRGERLQDRGATPWVIEPPPVLVTAEELVAAAMMADPAP